MSLFNCRWNNVTGERGYYVSRIWFYRYTERTRVSVNKGIKDDVFIVFHFDSFPSEYKRRFSCFT